MAVLRGQYHRFFHSNKSHSDNNFSPLSIGSIESISTNRSISLFSGLNPSVTEDPNAYKYFTSWDLHHKAKSFCFFDICSLIITIQRYYFSGNHHWERAPLIADGPAIKLVGITWRSTGQGPGTLAENLSRCKEGMVQVLPSRYKVGWALRVSRYKVDANDILVTVQKF